MRISNVIIAYFVIGAVMFGGGAIDFEEAGVANFFLEQESPDEVRPTTGNESATGELDSVGGAITELAELLAGPIIFVWNLFVGLIAYLNWPVFVLISHNAPMGVVVLLGGTPTAMFYMGVIRLVRTSA